MAPPHHSRDKGHVRHGRMITERNRGNTLTGPKGLCSLANIAPRCGKVFHSALRCIARSSVASLPSHAKPDELRPLAVTAALAQQSSEQTRRRWTALTGVLQHHQTAPVVSRTHAVRETMMVFLEIVKQVQLKCLTVIYTKSGIRAGTSRNEFQSPTSTDPTHILQPPLYPSARPPPKQ